jgi:hypothetical protein
MSSRKVMVCLAAVFAVFCASTTMAALIPVGNTSFEATTIADGDIGTYGPWDHWSDASAFVPAAFNPSADYYSTATGTGTPTGADGTNVSLINVTGPGQGVILQDLTATFEAGKTYTFSGLLGRRQESWTTRAAADHYDLFLKDLVTNTTLASYTIAGSALAYDSFTPASCSYTVTPDDPAIGHEIRVMFGLTADVAGDQYADFDNFQLTATPEPSTLVLLGTSLVGLLAYAWRKRK